MKAKIKKLISNGVTLSFFGAVLLSFPMLVGVIYMRDFYRYVRKICK